MPESRVQTTDKYQAETHEICAYQQHGSAAPSVDGIDSGDLKRLRCQHVLQMGGGFIITGKSCVQDVWNGVRTRSDQTSALEDIDDVVPLKSLGI